MFFILTGLRSLFFRYAIFTHVLGKGAVISMMYTNSFQAPVLSFAKSLTLLFSPPVADSSVGQENCVNAANTLMCEVDA